MRHPGLLSALAATLLLTLVAEWQAPAARSAVGPLAAALESVQVELPVKGEGHKVLAVGPDGRTLLAWNVWDGAFGKVKGAKHADSSNCTGYVAEWGTGSHPTLRMIAKVPHRQISDILVREDGFVLLSGNGFVSWTDDNPLAGDIGGFMTRFDAAGRQSFEVKVAGRSGREFQKIGDREFEGGRLAWSGKTLAAYFVVLNLFADGVTHQGDVLTFVDDTGKLQPGGWNWGVSHSFGPRVAFDGQRFITATVGDASPRGLVVNVHGDARAAKRRAFFPATGKLGDNTVPVVMGDLVATKKGSAVAFVDNDDRPVWRLHDIGLVVVTPDGTPSQKRWVTATDDVDECHVRMAAYGDRLFMVYATKDVARDDDWLGAVIDWEGRVVAGPEPVPANLDTGRLVSYPNGDVAWLTAAGGVDRSARVLTLHRLHARSTAN
jgi:hypothetical protein